MRGCSGAWLPHVGGEPGPVEMDVHSVEDGWGEGEHGTILPPITRIGGCLAGMAALSLPTGCAIVAGIVHQKRTWSWCACLGEADTQAVAIERRGV